MYGRTGSTQTKIEPGLVHVESKTNSGTGAGMYRWGSRRELLQSWAHTMVFQAEIYAIKAYIMDSIEKGYTGRNDYTLSNSPSHQGP